MRPDQYDKLKGWNCLCDIYVNHLGEVCLRKFERDPPHGGTVFAQTFWSDAQPLDKEGFPIFQNTRGICAKIFTPSHPANPNSKISNLYHQTTHKFRLLIHGKSSEGEELTNMMAKRNELYGDLAKIKRKYKLFTELKQQSENNQIAMKQNLQLIELYSSHCEPNATSESVSLEKKSLLPSLPAVDENLQVTFDHYRQSIENLKVANEEMRQLEFTLQSQLTCPDTILNYEMYIVERDKVKNELDHMKDLIKDFVNKNKYLFPS